MRKWVVSIFWVIGIIAVGYTQEMPAEGKRALGDDKARNIRIARNDGLIADESVRREHSKSIGANENMEPEEVESGTSGYFILGDTSHQIVEKGDK